MSAIFASIYCFKMVGRSRSMLHSPSLFYKLVSAQKTGRANLISNTDRQKAPAAREIVAGETALCSCFSLHPLSMQAAYPTF